MAGKLNAHEQNMKKYDFVVIGANGIQGKIVSRYLLESDFDVLLCANDDYGIEDLVEHPKADFAPIDLRKVDRVMKRMVKKSGAGVLVNCAVDDFNMAVTKMALDLGMNYVDLGSEEPMFYEQLKLDKDFKDKDIIGITGIGSTPGITNIMLRYIKPQFDTIETVHVGFAWDSNQPVFVTPFSIDAIAYEFSEPAKMLENGEYVLRQPHECDIGYYYKTIGKQRTQYTKHIEHHSFYEYLKNDGIKNIIVLSSFPTHSYVALKALIGLGFMSKETIALDGHNIRPLDFTIEVLRRIPVPEGYTEKENLFLKVFGAKDGRPKTVEMDATAGTLPGWEKATCNIDTGFPAAILAKMILKGEIKEKGMFSPEFVVPPEPFFAELGKSKIWIYEDGKRINGANGEINGNGHGKEKAEVSENNDTESKK
ncbi:MAG: saccharopine dehydrogenase NADP-binding domain-containing protein [Candidatus Sungbacteria bacterium]|uniref:Saccharopine dehydrogenase NADP-binding domain-containing protein n=2 Tax=Candidatus Sungiibacteriota bacterium TaxID=2750080 RepID=A0A9D6DRN3_9BACT|nr:saccharopine dehydrogenase NADP-binding domain-containing protein [Candidatus Sungbacteria bacterium]